MLIFRQVKELQKHLQNAKKQGQTVGFVPTMGALHAGHISLIKTSLKRCKISVCSIFINPTQFNDPHDFENYPVTIDHDIKLLSQAGCQVLFLPSVKEIYPNGTALKKGFKFGIIANILEGAFRPGHFDGMAQVVQRLLSIVKPDVIFMGQKDYQQQLIVQLLIKKMNIPTRLVMCPTMRQKDGLAMSSRNVRLGDEGKKLATALSKALKLARRKIQTTKTEIPLIEQLCFNKLTATTGIEPEYFEIRNAKTLTEPRRRTEKLVGLVAAKVDGVRLIDNMVLN